MKKIYFVYRNSSETTVPQHMYVENIGQTWPIHTFDGWKCIGTIEAAALPLPEGKQKLPPE